MDSEVSEIRSADNDGQWIVMLTNGIQCQQVILATPLELLSEAHENMMLKMEERSFSTGKHSAKKPKPLQEVASPTLLDQQQSYAP